MKMIFVIFITQLLIILYLSIKFRNLKRSLCQTQYKSLSAIRKTQTLIQELHLSFEKLFEIRQLPLVIAQIPFADEKGIIRSVKTINIPAVPAPYNASIIEKGSGYLLFFRFDIPTIGKDHPPFFSSIGCINLDRDFKPTEKTFSKIKTNSNFSEDARIFQNGNRSFLVYNDLISDSKNRRGIRIASIDLDKKSLDFITSLSLPTSRAEKNWTPFSLEGEIHFLYSINPQKIFKVPNPEKNFMSSISLSTVSKLDWPDIWGTLRGGTPAKLVDGEYLAFFHSSFEDYRGIVWYIMGAYTFESSYPFRITRISPHPILFNGIYDTAHKNTANPNIRSIYPAGFIVDGDLIHVSCGENDSAVKIITMDKKNLLLSLKQIHHPSGNESK